MASSLPAGTPRRLKELIPSQVAAILADDPRLIVPVGTCEQHGPHLPLGCDTVVVERLADDLSIEFGVLLAPTFEYGVNVDTERAFAGNGSLRKKTIQTLETMGMNLSWERVAILSTLRPEGADVEQARADKFSGARRLNRTSVHTMVTLVTIGKR